MCQRGLLQRLLLRGHTGCQVAPAYCPLVVLFSDTAPMSRRTAGRFGKMPTTSVRRISLFRRSWGCWTHLLPVPGKPVSACQHRGGGGTARPARQPSRVGSAPLRQTAAGRCVIALLGTRVSRFVMKCVRHLCQLAPARYGVPKSTVSEITRSHHSVPVRTANAGTRARTRRPRSCPRPYQ